MSRTNRRDNSDGTLYSLSEFVMQTTVELSKSIFYVIKGIVMA